MRHAFSIDLEDWYNVLNLSSAIPRERWPEQESRVEGNVLRLLDLLAEHHVRATFFVLGWIARQKPELIKRIAGAGHEIASHGMMHDLVYRMRPDEFRAEMIESRALLEELGGQPVRGFRASNFSITRASLWALEILHELGFEYDSSIFPFQRRRYGIAGAPVGPHRRPLKDGAGILEIPPSVVKLGLLVLPVAGGGYFRLLPYEVTRRAVKRIEREGRPFCYYLHPWEIDPEQPRVGGLPAAARFLHYQNLSATETKLKQLLGDFEFGTYGEVAERMMQKERPC